MTITVRPDSRPNNPQRTFTISWDIGEQHFQRLRSKPQACLVVIDCTPGPPVPYRRSSAPHNREGDRTAWAQGRTTTLPLSGPQGQHKVTLVPGRHLLISFICPNPERAEGMQVSHSGHLVGEESGGSVLLRHEIGVVKHIIDA